jgi:hypothetical protein
LPSFLAEVIVVLAVLFFRRVSVKAVVAWPRYGHYPWFVMKCRVEIHEEIKRILVNVSE